jgi:ABC-type branched-subunit amino acid transport system permease subunit
MLQTRLKQFIDSLHEGLGAGFVAGVVILFLILLGIPIQMENLALFLFFLIIFIFGVRLARHLGHESAGHLLKNALAMGLTTALMILLFMALINRWQARGIDVKQYFDAVSTQTVTVLSGVPESELHPNPPVDLFTGKYPEDQPLRTSPMRLSFDSKTGLQLKLGLAGSSWFDINLIVGGLYGFLLLAVLVGTVGALITRALRYTNLDRIRGQASTALTGNPITHWGILLLPFIFFVLLWLTVAQGSRAPVLSLGSSSQEIQLLLTFGIILWALVAVRAARPSDSGLNYTMRLGVCLGIVVVLVALGIWRVTHGRTYIMATSHARGGSETLSIVAMIVVGGILAVQNMLALREPGRLEAQFAATVSCLVVLLMPLYLNQYQNDVMTLVGINILLGLGLNIVVGYAGLLDLGYVAFFALGAYSYAFLSSNQQRIGDNNQPIGLKFKGNDEMVIKLAGWGVITVVVTLIVVFIGLRLWQRRQTARRTAAEEHNTLISLPARPTLNTTILLTVIAVAVSLVAAVLLDHSGLYHRLFDTASPFLIGTIIGVVVSGLAGIMLGIPVLRLRGDYLAIVTLGFGEIIRLLFNNLRDYTGGPQGVLQIPRPLPVNASGPVTYLWLVYLVFTGAGLVAFFSMRLRRSRTGRAWSAMQSDEDIAQSMGINLVQSKLTAFAIGAAFAGIGGVLFAARQRNIFPNDFKLDVSIQVLSLVIIGGMGSIPGVIMGAIALIGVPEVLRELSTYRILVFGALLVVMVIIRPEGLLPEPPSPLGERGRKLAHGRFKTSEPGEGQV